MRHKIANSYPTPMPAIDQQWQGHVIKNLTGISAIGLQQVTIGVSSAANACTIFKDPLGTSVILVLLRIAGKRLAVAQVVAGT